MSSVSLARPVPAETPHDLEATFTDKEFAFFAALVYDMSGIVLGKHKKNMMFSRLVRRVRELKLQSFQDYCALVRGPEGGAEIGALINAMTTNLTKFFREEHHFDYLAGTIAPQLKAEAVQTGQKRIRIWSAGCSSGEEPYSIAIALRRAIPEIRQWDARILATDLDTNMVARGAEGIYPIDTVSELSPARRNGFFEPVPEDRQKARVIQDLRALITFKPLNLLHAWPMSGPFDAIFCRNVMIYFDSPTKTDLISRLTSLLKPNGWLFLGHSETLLDHQNALRLVGRTIYQRKA